MLTPLTEVRDIFCLVITRIERNANISQKILSTGRDLPIGQRTLLITRNMLNLIFAIDDTIEEQVNVCGKSQSDDCR